MLGKQGWGRLGFIGLALALTVQAGCLSFVHPVDPLPVEEVKAHLDLPDACKNGVHVFFLHGLDPLDLGNLSGLHDYVQSLGFKKTYYGQPFHAFYYEQEIRKLREREPGARIVLIGFSYGAGLLRDLCCSLRRCDIDIDLLVYLDGVEFEFRPLHRPANVHKVVNILSFGRTEKRKVAGGDNYQYADSWHFGTVTHPDTVRILVQELGLIARGVPVVTYLPAAPPAPGAPVDPAPPPGTLPAPTPVGRRGEWDFLKPDAHGAGDPGRKPGALASQTPPATLGMK